MFKYFDITHSHGQTVTFKEKSQQIVHTVKWNTS